jgi:immunity protein, SdpI family
MNFRTPLIVSFVLIAAMVAVSAWGWVAVPAHAQMAVHWGVDGRPNGFMSKTGGLLMLPGVAIALTGLFVLIPKIEPRRANLLASRKLYLTGWYGGIAMLAFAHLLTVMNAAGLQVDTPRWIVVAVSLLFLAIGNFMGKSRSTFLVGLRLPWTLASEAAWEKSSRIAGRGLVATGVATLVTVIFAGTAYGAAICAIGALLSFTIGGVASYIYWKRDANRSNGDSIHE